jgi:putative ATP-dependent endonuclease of OLD family
MIIKNISIYNFRGIEKLEKLEVSNLNTFVGKNDSGKSTILSSLECFFNEKKFSNKDFFRGNLEDEKTVIEISFSAQVKIDDSALDENKEITISKEFHSEKGKIKAQAYYLSYDYLEEKYQDLWNKKEQELNLLIKEFGEEPKKSGRGKKNIIRIQQLKTLLTEKQRKNIKHKIGDLIKNLNNVYDISLPEYLLFDAEQDLDIGATNFQSQFKPIISAYFENAGNQTKQLEKELKKDLAKEFEEIRKFMAKNVPELKQLNPTTEFDWSKSLKKFDLNLEFNNQEFDIPISHKGTGFKRLLMVAYFEYLASKKNVKNQIFAIEEPETYLHPSAQDDLLQSIVRISEKSQFFLTTHSPIYAGATNGQNTILVTKNKKGISEYQKGNEIIPQIINELGIKPDYNLLENTKFLIFVEGPDDLKFIQIAAQTIFEKNLESDKIICVWGGGSSLKNYADLGLFKKLSNGTDKYAVIVDGDNHDEAKEKEKTVIRSRCKSDGAMFHELSKKEIENYCHPAAISRVCPSIKFKDIQINDETNVPKHLKELGLHRKFKNDTNVDVFTEMTKEEWLESDEKKEISNFIQEIYINLGLKIVVKSLNELHSSPTRTQSFTQTEAIEITTT